MPAPSETHRWFTCPSTALVVVEQPVTKEVAQRGIEAHALLEKELEKELEKWVVENP